jgi:hypothetical protein
MGSSSHESQRERRLLIRLIRVAWKPDLGLAFALMSLDSVLMGRRIKSESQAVQTDANTNRAGRPSR